IYIAMSTDTGHAFSRGGLTISQMCHSLSDQSTQAATVLSSWAAVSGVITEGQIIQRLRRRKHVRKIEIKPIMGQM
ncbi:hypothetical protein K439DRAFT_1367632, partial [Ramaria rubella]